MSVVRLRKQGNSAPASCQSPLVLTALALYAALAAGAVHAGSVQLGIGAGYSRGKVDCLADLACDRSDSGFKAYVGYEVAPAVDVRLGYFDGGRYRGADTTPLGTEFGGTFRISGVALTAGYRWSFAPAWDLHGQVGAASVRTRFDYNAPFSGSASKTNVQPIAGVSLGYAIAPAFRLGLDYDATRFKAYVTHGLLQSLGISAQYAF